MPPIFVVRHLKTSLLSLIFAIAITGCSKKIETASVATSTADADTNASVAATTPATSSTNVPVLADINQSFEQVDESLKANDYDKAVQTLLTVQEQKQLTAQQAQEAQSKMIGLQRSLANAIAAGDPNAKAAGELLRNSSKHVK
jgi:hypothetical protein